MNNTQTPPLTRITHVEVRYTRPGEREGDVTTVYLRGEVAGAGNEARWDSDHTSDAAATARAHQLAWRYGVPIVDDRRATQDGGRP